MHIFMIQNKVKFFKALGDETRLNIVKYLLNNNYCACEFTSMTNKDQTTVSRHLKVLVEAGILKYKKDGRNIIYSIENNEVKRVLINFGIKGANYCCEGECNERK